MLFLIFIVWIEVLMMFVFWLWKIWCMLLMNGMICVCGMKYLWRMLVLLGRLLNRYVIELCIGLLCVIR